jgi:hypothetical protein
LVKITPFIKNQINILNLRDNFSFYNNLFKGMSIWLFKCLYIDRTMKDSCL